MNSKIARNAKKGDYFRFLSAQKLTTPTMHTTATAMIRATSVVINGASGVSASGVSGVNDCAVDQVNFVRTW